MQLEHPILGKVLLTERAPGVYVTEQGHYIPFPGANDFFTNPVGPSFGQAATGDVWRVIVQFGAKNAAKPFARNVFHYTLSKISGSPTFAAVATELLKQLFTALASPSAGSGISNLYNSSYSFRNPQVRSLKTSTDSLDGSNDQDGNGQSTTGLVPLRSAVVMHHGTAKAGRSFSGRTFWPAPDETEQTAGALISAAKTFAENTAGSLTSLDLSAAGGAGSKGELSVYSPTQSKKASAIVATPVSSLTIRNVMGSQRRRQDVSP